MKQHIKVIITIGIVGGILQAFSFINPYFGEITLSELVLQLSGARGEFPLGNSLNEMLEFSERLLPGFVFSAFAGKMLYQHFCTASVYVFSRQTNRTKWYMKIVFRIFWDVMLFYMIFMGTAIIVTVWRYQLIVDEVGINLAFYHYFIHSLWLFSMILLINFVSTFIGSGSAYLFVIGGQLLLIALLSLDILEEIPILRAVNPIAHLVLSWYRSKNAAYENVLVCRYPYFDLTRSLGGMVLASVCAVVLGLLIVKKKDLVILDLETEG